MCSFKEKSGTLNILLVRNLQYDICLILVVKMPLVNERVINLIQTEYSNLGPCFIQTIYDFKSIA